MIQKMNNLDNFKNNPKDIISAWIALEALSPQTFVKPEELANDDRSCITTLRENYLPWQQNEKSRKDRQLYYLVVLGSIPLKYATEQLVKIFGEDEEYNLREKSSAVLAAVLLDRSGCLLKEKAIGVSSFGWALPQALNKQLNNLANWADVEENTVKQLEEMLNKVDEEGNSIPLNYESLECAWQWLVSSFGLSCAFVEKPKYVIRVYHHLKSKKPPEVSLLNSFFLHDLALVSKQLKQGNLPVGLSYYLGINKHDTSIDILANKNRLEDALAPHKINAARWPSVGGYPLVTLQQAAVNLAREQLASNSGIVAINGPPGTGKTTLLRDVIVSAVVDRAIAMCQFDDPNKAFTATDKKKSAGKGFFNLYKLADSLKGHEIVVASSNNKAVENVSKELPALKAIDSSYTEKLSYFKSISDTLFNTDNSKTTGDDEIIEDSSKQLETWGLIAAVLGNSTNRYAFQQAFWWDNENSFQTYLKAAKGDNPIIEEMDKEGNKIRRQRTIVQQEKPPSSAAIALNEWKQAKTKFIQLKQEIDAQLQLLVSVRKQWHSLVNIKQQIQNKNNLIIDFIKQLGELDSSLTIYKDKLSELNTQIKELNVKLMLYKKERPNFFARFFLTQRWKLWSAQWNELINQLQQLNNQLQENTTKESNIVNQQKQIESEVNNQKQGLSLLLNDRQQLDDALSTAKTKYGTRFVDEKYLFAEHEVLHKNSPWIPDELHRKREALFVAALAVQKAFIGVAAQKYQHNLSFLIDAMNNGLSADYNDYLPDIWSTLFSVVPVVSTTFASVEAMFGKLPQESIGWLLIDEAGQASPQFAVGAIFRSKRILVVGDPLQIPPVVSLPKELNKEICNYFSVDENSWSAPMASTQVLADRASLYQSRFENTEESSKVGLPLLVHRRCQNPMFSISNQVAYNNQMVHAVSQKPLDKIATLLGESCWFNVDGEASSKWCPAEGQLALQLFTNIVSNVDKPEVFIITPFRDVAYNLKNLLREEKTLSRRLNITAEKKWSKWLDNNIGTVHTFQGREAETVIFILGAPNSNQNGARKWAAETPNIINVAVSRAKNNLYVIGSHGAWSGVGFARDLANKLHIQQKLKDSNQYQPNIPSYVEDYAVDNNYCYSIQNMEDVYMEEVVSEYASFHSNYENEAFEYHEEDHTPRESNKIVDKQYILKKICSKCNQSLTVDHFFSSNKYDDGLSKWCKDCLKALEESKTPISDCGGYKVCLKCQKKRRKSSFYRSKKNSDGLTKWCKDCLENLPTGSKITD